MIYLLHGPDTFRSLHRLRQLVSEFRANFPDGIVERFYFDSPAVLATLSTSSFFTSPRLVVISNWSQASAQAQTALLDLLTNPDSLPTMILWEDEILPSSPWLAGLSKIASTEQFLPQRGSDLDNYLASLIRETKIDLSPAQTKWLWQRSQADLWTFANHLAKLSALPQPINRDFADWLVPTQSDESDFALTDAILSGNLRSAHHILQTSLVGDGDIQRQIGGLAAQLRSLIRVHTQLGQGQSPSAIAKQTGIHPFVVGKLVRYQLIPITALKQLYLELADLDWQIKSGQLIADDAIAYFLARLSALTSRSPLLNETATG